MPHQSKLLKLQPIQNLSVPLQLFRRHPSWCEILLVTVSSLIGGSSRMTASDCAFQRIEIPQLAFLLGGFRYRFVSEVELQDGIAKVLHGANLNFERELTLPRVEGVRMVAGVNDRPDFIVDGIAVEVKIKGGLSALLRQMSRYADHPSIRGVLAIGTPRWLDGVPSSLSGKPVHGLRLISSLF